MRKIIQIAVAGASNTEQHQGVLTVIALCDDGSLWSQTDWGTWYRIETDAITPSDATEPQQANDI